MLRMIGSKDNLLRVLTVCALTAGAHGCTAPWTQPYANLSDSSPAVARMQLDRSALPATSLSAASPAQIAAASPPISAVASSSEPDLTPVLDSLQRVRQIDPAAEQRLLDELRRTPAKQWPLVAEQFRASLAYHEQLSSSRSALREASMTSAPMVMRDSSHSTGDTLGQAASAAENRPSEPFGRLVDPRQLDSSDAGSATPLQDRTASLRAAADNRTATPSPTQPTSPAEFVQHGPVYPIPSPAVREAADSRRTSYGARDVPSAQSAVQLASADVPVPATRHFDAFSASTGASHHIANLSFDSDWREHVAMAAEALNQSVPDSPTSTAEVHQHVSLRILRLLQGDTEAALQPIPHISPTEQDFWSGQLFGLATYLDHHTQPDDKRRAAVSAPQFDDALSSLRELGSLSVRNLSFCKSVYGYGAIEPYDVDRFIAGQQVSLYVEVENYHSRATADGYCTSLGSTYEILDEKGTRVGGGTIPDVNDCCRNRRRDFHIEYGLQLPEKLASGRYRLDLVIKDRQSDKIGHATVSFEIGGVAP